MASSYQPERRLSIHQKAELAQQEKEDETDKLLKHLEYLVTTVKREKLEESLHAPRSVPGDFASLRSLEDLIMIVKGNMDRVLKKAKETRQITMEVRKGILSNDELTKEADKLHARALSAEGADVYWDHFRYRQNHMRERYGEHWRQWEAAWANFFLDVNAPLPQIPLSNLECKRKVCYRGPGVVGCVDNLLLILQGSGRHSAQWLKTQQAPFHPDNFATRNPEVIAGVTTYYNMMEALLQWGNWNSIPDLNKREEKPPGKLQRMFSLRRKKKDKDEWDHLELT